MSGSSFDPPPDGYSKTIARTREAIDQMLERKKQEIASIDTANQGETSRRYQAWKRRLLCDQLRRDHLEIYDIREVFISYSGTGRRLFDMSADYFKDHKYKLRHGSEAGIRAGDYIPSDIIAAIKQCSCFLAIWTRTYDAQRTPHRSFQGSETAGDRGSIPSVWMPFELGVAMALNKPYKVMVEEGTMSDFLEKPSLGKSKIVFRHETFLRELQVAKDYFERRFIETKAWLTLPLTELPLLE